MNIVVLDGYTLNPGDLDWEGLRSIGQTVIHDRTSPEDVLPRAMEAEIVLTNKTRLPRVIIRALPRLKYIGVLATGFDVVDTIAASERGVIVTNVPTYGTMSVAQAVFAHLFNLTHRIGHHAGEVRRGRWSESADFSFRDYPLLEVSGLTMGLVGLGRIGKATAVAAAAFGMMVIAHDPGGFGDGAERVRSVSLADVFNYADVVSLHCPLTASTRGLVNRERLAMMKSSAFLINTSRGHLVDEEALADALNGGRIAGAGLDVLAEEPPRADNPLLSARNCFVTPHFAWATTAARTRLLQEVIQNVQAFLKGTPRNVVTPRPAVL